jgi:hypothetical protein
MYKCRDPPASHHETWPKQQFVVTNPDAENRFVLTTNVDDYPYVFFDIATNAALETEKILAGAKVGAKVREAAEDLDLWIVLAPSQRRRQ